MVLLAEEFEDELPPTADADAGVQTLSSGNALMTAIKSLPSALVQNPAPPLNEKLGLLNAIPLLSDQVKHVAVVVQSVEALNTWKWAYPSADAAFGSTPTTSPPVPSTTK